MVDSLHHLPAQGRHNLLLMYIVLACLGTGQDGVDMPVWRFALGFVGLSLLFVCFCLFYRYP